MKNLMTTTFRIALAAASFFGATGIIVTAAPINITVTETQMGTTPDAIGHNMGHFMPGSNAPDWWRYTGAKAARLFFSPSGSEVKQGNNEGVTTLETFNARRDKVRANVSNPNQTINTSYINLPFWENNRNTKVWGGNRGIVTWTLNELNKKQGVEFVFVFSAGLSNMPYEDEDDWAGKWLLWEFYYTQAILFGRDYDVRRYIMHNEPNANDAPIPMEGWLRRMELASDAIQCGIADVNARYGKNLVPQFFAPNSAGSTSTGSLGALTWGRAAVANRHRRYDGTIDPNWRNFHFYNYQKYGQSSASFYNDHMTILNDINGRIGDETPYEAGITEFNSLTAGYFDNVKETADHYSHFAAMGSTFIALTQANARQMYLFKFAASAREDNHYPIAKNGTHYANNDEGDGSVNNYGGALQSAEVYRLFLKAAQSARPWYKLTGDEYQVTSGSDPDKERRILVTRDEANGFVHIFAGGRNSANVEVNLNLSTFNVPAGNAYLVEEVSDRSRGGIVKTGTIAASGILNYTFPGRTVTLISIPTRPQAVMDTGSGSHILEVKAVADAQLTDGALKSTPAGGGSSAIVRSTGLSADGRQLTVIKIPVPAIASPDIQFAMLDLHAATTNSGTWAQTHVYGLEDDNWEENTVTWANLTTALKQDVPVGNKINNNVIANQGSLTTILAPLVVTTTGTTEKMINVTDFVRRQTDGFVSFVIVQDFRSDWTLDTVSIPFYHETNEHNPVPPNNIPGDTQPCGISIVMREGENASVKGPRLLIAATSAPTAPTLTAQPMSTQVDEGTSVTLTVGLENTAGITYQWRKDGVEIEGATSSTLTLSGAVTDAGVYDVVVKYGPNPSDSVTSHEAYVVIIPPPTPAPDSPFTQPVGIAADAAGHLYVSDYSRHIIQTIAPNNYLSTLAGESGVPGSRNAVGTIAQFRNPTGLAVHGGKLYVADTGNAVIRSVSDDATVLPVGGGVGVHGFADGLGAAARFNYPEAVASDADGNLYVADTENHTVRKIAVSGTVTTLGEGYGIPGLRDGMAIEALYALPAGIAVAGSGSNLVVYVADTGNHVIRKIANGQVSTFAGTPREPGSSDGPLLSARFREPRGMVVDGDGTLYIADTGNSLIRAISGTTVTTIAGLPATDAIPGLAGYKDGKGEGAWFSNPESLALGPDGKLYVADTGNRVIRVIDLEDNVTTVAASTRPQPPPPEDMYDHNDSDTGGGGASSFWMLGAMAALTLYRKLRR